MSEFFYVLKVALATLILIMFMQVKVGSNTIESHFESFVKTSSVTAPVREIAEHGFIAIKGAYTNTVHFLNAKLFKKSGAPGERSFFALKRNQIYEEEQKLKEDVKEDIESFKRNHHFGRKKESSKKSSDSDYEDNARAGY